MRTPWQYLNHEPFELRSNVILFHDWRYVNHGYPGWRDPGGQAVPVFGVGELPPIHFSRGDIPYGVKLHALPAQKSEPFFRPEMPWEGLIGAPSVLREQGRYRLWYESVAPSMLGSKLAGHTNLLCYAESGDGRVWRRGDFSHLEYEGRERGNIVYGGSLAGPWGYHGGCVFADSSAPSEERYKAFYLARLSRGEAETFRSRSPERTAPWPDGGADVWGMAGAVSPDGLLWTRLPEPLVLHLSDTHNTAYYDSFLKKYVAYMRTWVMGRRSIGRAETDDFRGFPLPETFCWPGADVGATDTWYGNGKTVYPGATDYHLLFPWRWRIADDRFHTFLLTSPDGILWAAPPQNLMLAPGERDAWDAGGTISGLGLVELPGNRVGLPYVGYRVPHKYPRRPPLGQFAWATWERDRLVALEAEEEGEFSTWIVRFQGNQLRLNACTKHSGQVRIEVLGPDRQPLPGRRLEDCDPIDGNFLDRLVTWRGEARLAPDPRPLGFRIQMSRAELFSLRFE